MVWVFCDNSVNMNCYIDDGVLGDNDHDVKSVKRKATILEVAVKLYE